MAPTATYLSAVARLGVSSARISLARNLCGYRMSPALNEGVAWLREGRSPSDVMHGHSEFAGLAQNYDIFRPDYPAALFDRVVSAVSEHPYQLRVADIGAGTGRGAFALAKMPQVATVYAVEPDMDMLSVCRESYEKNAKEYDVDFKIEQGHAEATTLASADIDLAVCLQAWHWTDNAFGLEEMARVIRPGGVLAVAWNDRDLRDPFVQKLEALIEKYNISYDRTMRQCDNYSVTLSINPKLKLEAQDNIPHHMHGMQPKDIVNLTQTFTYVKNSLSHSQLEAFKEECLALATAEQTRLEQSTGQKAPPIVIPLQTRLYILRRV